MYTRVKLVKESLEDDRQNNLEDNFDNNSLPNTIYPIIDYLDSIPEFQPYRNKNAQYDDKYYDIPAKVFTSILDWTPEDIKAIQDQIESYEGRISWVTEIPGKRNERDQIISWIPLPFEDQSIEVLGGA